MGRGASPAERLPSAPFPCARPSDSSTHCVRLPSAHCQPSVLRTVAAPRPGRAGTLRTEIEEGDISVSLFYLDPGGYLLFRAVASQVPSAYEGLTSVFGMGTGGTLQLNHRKFRMSEHPENCIESDSFGSSPRPISIDQLHALLHFHLRPINHIVYMGSYHVDRVGDLILRSASRLDAFSVYPLRTWLPSSAAGATTDSPLVRPSRSSRTKDSASQISCAHDG